MPAPAPPATGLGEFIRDARERVGLSQGDVALALGIHQTVVSGWERGKHYGSIRKHASKLAETLQVSPTRVRDLWWDEMGGYLAPLAA